MKISSTKKIDIAEFPAEVRPWIGKLVNPLNKFFEQMFFAQAKGLTIADNLKAQAFDVEITPNQTWPMKVSWTLNERPTAVFLGFIQEVPGGGTIPVHSMQWSFNNGVVEFTINGLSSAVRYKVRIVGMV